MEPPPPVAGKVCFGVFEADLAAGELRKRARKVPLQEQPFQVLVLLLHHAGEVVTREELQHALWPSDTFVEFEQGVNTAIKKLRQALGDSADNPRFIETLPRKGYRFIAPVTGIEAHAAPPARRRFWILLPTAAVVLAAIVGAVWLYKRTRAPEKSTVPVLLTGYLGSKSTPSFSPDGQRVVFDSVTLTEDNVDIFVEQLGENEPIRLTTDPAPDYAPAWSPDGRSIAFLRFMPGGAEGVFLMPAVGGAARKIAEIHPLGDCHPSWHPGGRWLVVSDQESQSEPPGVFLLSAETGEKRRLTSPPKTVAGDSFGAVSPDGRFLVFARSLSGHCSDLYLLELSKGVRPAGPPKRLITKKSYNVQPVWSPDGRSIVFVCGQTMHHTGLCRMALSGVEAVGLPELLPFQDARWPAISRQGALVYARQDFDFDIWRLDLTGSRKMERLGINSARLDHTPQYSPDGSRIAFGSDRSGNHEIWTCSADGSNALKLTSFGGPYVADPAWSPDGRRIAFAVETGGNTKISVIGSSGGTPETLVREDWLNGNIPSWSRDGEWVYFGSKLSGTEQLWKMPVRGGRPKQITKKGGTAGVESPDGKYLYYRKNGDPGLWKVPVDPGGWR